MTRPFYKMHGLGNDFVIFDSRSDGFIPDAKTCQLIADRHCGVGFDQTIMLLRPERPDVDVRIVIKNADGSEVNTCGNATRCVGRLMFEETGKNAITVQTNAGLLKVTKDAGDLIAVDFGTPWLAWNEIPLAKDCDTLNVPVAVDGYKTPCCVSMGNPHAVFFVPDAEQVPLAAVGPKLEHDPMFPERCNIEFAHIINRTRIRMRVWERGTGITQACGSGACATLIAAVRRDLSDRRAVIVLDGGELTIEWRESDGHVLMAGPAAMPFKGNLLQYVD